MSVRLARRMVAAAAMLAAGVPASLAAPDEPSLEQLLAHPFPSRLVASSVDTRFAWVVNDRGRRNVWIAEAAGGEALQARQATAYAEDDGTEISDLGLGRNGLLVFTRGGLTNGERPANPSGRARGPIPSAIWSLSPATPIRKVGEGHSPAVSPTDDGVAFVADGALWLGTGIAPGEPRLIVRDHGRIDSPRWSPDGARLAFVSRRGNRSYVGVYRLGAERVTWLSPSIHLDAFPAWSPDGRSVAFIRIPASASALQSFRFLPRPAGPPWSIWIADADTGAGRMAWQAGPGPGSVFRPIGSSQLQWSGRRLIFPWEARGWLQLHALDVDGGAVELLTPGPQEVFNAALSGDRRQLIYSSNANDIDRRRLWRLRLGGGSPVAVSGAARIEDFPAVSPDGAWIVGLVGDSRSPIAPVAFRNGKEAPLAGGVAPAAFAKLPGPVPVVVTADDGVAVHGQLFAPPPGRANGAAILYFHGGPARQTLLGWHPLHGYSLQYAANQVLAARGYTVLSLNYRGSEGYGLAFREPPQFSAAGASELKDVVAAAQYLRRRPGVNARCLGAWGGSYGGRMVSLALARAPDLFAAGVADAGNHDLGKMIESIAAKGQAVAPAPLAWQSSAMAAVEAWRAPVLLVHSEDDRAVPLAQTSELSAALAARGIDHELLIQPDETHDKLRFASWLQFLNATIGFFDRKLGGTCR